MLCEIVTKIAFNDHKIDRNKHLIPDVFLFLQTTPVLSVDLTGLEPYTSYTIEVSVSNRYTTGDQPHGPPIDHTTAEGGM